MILSSADIFFFKISLFLVVAFSKMIFRNISRVLSSLDPDHARRSKEFAKVISRRH